MDKNSNVEYLISMLGLDQAGKNAMWRMYATKRAGGLWGGDFEDFLWAAWRATGQEEQMRTLFAIAKEID